MVALWPHQPEAFTLLSLTSQSLPDQWFSSFRHQNHLERILKMQIPGFLHKRFLCCKSGVRYQKFYFNKNQVILLEMGPIPHLEEPCNLGPSLKT